MMRRYGLLCMFLMATVILNGCRSLPFYGSDDVRTRALFPVLSKIDPENESVAVSWICEANTHDITALGTLWRDRIEKAFSDHCISVKGRRDLFLVIDDMESFGPRRDEKAIWEQAGAEVVVTGSYRVIETPGQPAEIKLLVKALRVETAEIVGTAEWSELLPPDWKMMASRRQGNAYHKKLDIITAPEDIKNKPALTARFDRTDACYATGETGEIVIETEPGVHIYLLNLNAEDAVTLLYPNRLCPAGALSKETFVFPPPDCKEKFELVFYPFDAGGTSRESVVVVASRESLDFSFLPVPIHQVFLGAEGGDIKKVYDILDGAKSWSEVHLAYTVGYDCEIRR